MGTGPFEASAVSEQLALRPDKARGSVVEHGVVEPAIPMPLTTYRDALAGTSDDWQEV